MPANYILWRPKDLRDGRGFNAGEILRCELLEGDILDCSMESEAQASVFSIKYGNFQVEGITVPRSDFVFLNDKDRNCVLNDGNVLSCTVDK